MKEKKIHEEVKSFIQKSKEELPFISNFWDITLITEMKERDIQYGHFKTSSDRHTVFYKPYSTIIDFDKLDE